MRKLHHSAQHRIQHHAQHNGVTLVELLVAMGIFMVILAAVTTSWIRTSSLVGGLVVESDLVEDVRNASAIMADGIAKAVYVYPPGAQLQLNKTPGSLIKNPNDSTNIFTVGNYVGSKMTTGGAVTSDTTTPIIAFLEAEQNPNIPCTVPSNPTTPPRPVDPNGCLTFVAYYFAKRGTLTAAGEPFDFIVDAPNNDKWMLLEYRNVTTLSSTKLEEVALPVRTEGGQAQLLTDYVDPRYLLIHYQDCATGEVNDPLQTCPANTTLGSGDFKLSVVNGIVRWRSGVSRRGSREYFSPEVPFAITPDNLLNRLLR